MVTKRPFSDNKPNQTNPIIYLFFAFFFLKTKMQKKHLFYSALASFLVFLKVNSKQRNLKKKWHTNFEKRYFYKIAWQLAKKHKMITECAKIAWDHHQNRLNMTSTWPR